VQSRSGGHFAQHWSSVLRQADELRARVWYRWRDVFLRQRRERRQQEALLALDARAALRQWTRRAEWQQKLEAAEVAISQRVQQRLLLSALDGWCRVTASNRSFVLLASAMERVLCQALQRRALSWLRLLLHREALLDWLVQRWERRRQRQAARLALLSWLSWSELQERLASHAALTRGRRRMRAFLLWRQQARRTRLLLDAADGFRDRAGECQKQRIFTRWHGVLKAQATLRQRLFLRWREGLRERQRQQERHEALLRWDMHAALRLWAAMASRQRELQRLEGLVSRRRLQRVRLRVLDAWAQRTATARAVAFLADAVQHIHRRVAQRRALAWISFAARRDGQLQQLTQRLQEQRTDQALQRALQQWRAHIQRSSSRRGKKHQQMQLQAVHFRQARALDSWKRRLVTLRSEAHKVSLIRARCRGHAQRARWLHWHAAMHSALFLRFEAGAVVRLRQASALRRWLRRLQCRRALRTALAQAEQAARALLQAQALRGWRAALKARRFKLVCIQWLSAWVDQRALRQALTRNWTTFHKQAAAHKHKMKRLHGLEQVQQSAAVHLRPDCLRQSE